MQGALKCVKIITKKIRIDDARKIKKIDKK